MLACLSSLRDAQFSSTRLAALTPFCCLVGAAVAGALALRRLQFRFAALQDGVEAVLAQQRQLLEGARPAPRRARAATAPAGGVCWVVGTAPRAPAGAC